MATSTATTATTTILPSPTSTSGCTLNTCAIDSSFYMYQIDLAPNITFLALFSTFLLCFTLTYLVTGRWPSFWIAMSLGLISEIAGYIGRILSYGDQWAETGFLMQIICLTIAPAFLTAGIYLCLSRIVNAFGPEHSRIPAAWYPRIFIPCDIIALILQAAGGAMAAIALSNATSLDTGDNVMIAGLVFQVFTLLVFIGICVDFGIAVRRRRVRDRKDKKAGSTTARLPWQLKGFLVCLGVATIAIFWRCCYRVAELNGGWTGPIIYHQDYFVWFEGFLITLAVAVLVLFHPALCLREPPEPAKGFDYTVVEQGS
ncbi:putative sphingoid long-chain base transporter RSB1 [Exophiala viscosa]|uniref:Sphingoid long-chain base transporter RSB1 n=1 Tax=Exophiala viscosa TaxID=2486360 RepID=A0AAN6DP95_9EURO|nr:putative sphingoid long-chain base transporter RSB1 [Exophiala viscosa]KAI1621155.1 putative sphingoid long-chain base transporter RSB1 [Exophiala viscosa]